MNQDDFYQRIESEAWFQRNLVDYDAQKAHDEMMLRSNKKSIYDFLQESLELGSLSVLEIGCSVGDLLFTLKEKHQCHVVGVEPSISAARVASRTFRLNVEAKTFLNSSLFSLDNDSKGQFSLIILDDVVGWMDPKALLSSLGIIDWLLNEDGHLFVRELYSPHPFRIKNHHYPDEQVFNYRYPGGVTDFFLKTGSYRSVAEKIYRDTSLQKIESSEMNSLWKDALLIKSGINFPVIEA